MGCIALGAPTAGGSGAAWLLGSLGTRWMGHPYCSALCLLSMCGPIRATSDPCSPDIRESRAVELATCPQDKKQGAHAAFGWVSRVPSAYLPH